MELRDTKIRILVEEHCKDELSIINASKLTSSIGSLPVKGVTDEEVAEAEEKIQAYRLKLSKMSQAEIDALMKEFVNKNKEEQRHKELFFNQPDAVADFKYWGKIAGYKPEEAAALLLSKDPNKVNSESLKPFSQISDFPQKYAQSLTLISRAVSMGELKGPIQPGVFLEWAKQKNINIPDDLAKVIKECHDYVDWEAEYRELHEMNTKLKEYYDDLHGKYLVLAKTLKAERAEVQSPGNSKQSGDVLNSAYWQEFQSKAQAAIDAYLGWADEQSNKITSERVKDWLKGSINTDHREADLIKKILADIYPKHF